LALSEQKTLVVAVHVGYMDTGIAATVAGPETAPDLAAAVTLDAVEREVVADDISQ
jgi:hypothetical protein